MVLNKLLAPVRFMSSRDRINQAILTQIKSIYTKIRKVFQKNGQYEDT